MIHADLFYGLGIILFSIAVSFIASRLIENRLNFSD